MQKQRHKATESVEMTDCFLAQQVLAGDEEAFEILVRRYSSPLYNFICRFLNDYDLASDILQHVFTRLYLSLPELHTSEPLKPWLFCVARNRCLDELRRKRGIPFSQLQTTTEEDELSFLEAIPDNAPLPEEIAEQHDIQEMLQAAISTLPPKFRAVVTLRYASQLSFVEIARVLKIPEATAKTYFQRAKPLLRTAIKNQSSLVMVG